MSQIRESRRKTGSKYFLEVPASSLRSRSYTVDDIMQTRVTGQHQRWPVDADTTARFQRLTLNARDDRRSLTKLAIAVTLMLACGYGFFLLWSSMK